MPKIIYKMLVVEFKDKTYRIADHGWMGILFEKYTDMDGYFPLDNDELAEEFTPDERFEMELLFDK
jgi:hypothetical protein